MPKRRARAETDTRWLLRCHDCQWNYPQELLNRLFVGGDGNGGGYTPLICAPCALERTNVLHGIRRASFQGEIAEQMRQDALRWRQTHPEHKGR